MRNFLGWIGRAGVLMSEGPWGGRGGSSGGGNGNGNGNGGGRGPRNPWSPPPGGGGPRRPDGPSALDELLRRGRDSLGGMPRRPDGKPLWPLMVGILVLLWLAFSCVHRIGPQERGIVTLFGKYSRTLSPGIGLTLPAPIENVAAIDVEEIRTVDIGSASGDAENLMLTGDQNIIDLAYSVRWNIRDPQLFAFQLAEPEETIQEVAESAMRAVIASVSLDDALGAGRTVIEQQVEQRMQSILNAYRSGVRVQGIAIKQADPPTAVNDAFKEVSAAQQTAQTYLNEARAYAQQLTARAQGEAAAFDKVYAEYRLAPEVTRRRMYYETMEQVLAGVDKTIVETGNVTPYLPLPELKRRAEGSTAPAPAPAGEGQ